MLDISPAQWRNIIHLSNPTKKYYTFLQANGGILNSSPGQWENIWHFSSPLEKYNIIPKYTFLRPNGGILYIYPGLGIRSFPHRSVAHLLRSLKTNEQPWANRSGRSEEMSEREWISQVTQDKWGTVSDLRRSLRGNKRMSNSLKIFWLKKSKILFNYILFKV